MIVEDDPVVASHFTDIVRSCPHLELAAVAASIASARQMISCAPHLVLLDVGLPDGSGLSMPHGGWAGSPFGLPGGNVHPWTQHVKQQIARGNMRDPITLQKLARMQDYQRRMARASR